MSKVNDEKTNFPPKLYKILISGIFTCGKYLSTKALQGQGKCIVQKLGFNQGEGQHLDACLKSQTWGDSDLITSYAS